MPKNENDLSDNENQKKAKKNRGFKYDKGNQDPANNVLIKILAKQYKDAIPETENSVNKAKEAKINLSDNEIQNGAEENRDFEYSTSEQAVENKKNQLIIETADEITRDQRRKDRMREKLMKYFTDYFNIVSIFVGLIVFSNNFSENFKKVLIGGFFVNLIGLFAIIFKYVFSPSKELLEFFEVISNKKDKAKK